MVSMRGESRMCPTSYCSIYHFICVVMEDPLCSQIDLEDMQEVHSHIIPPRIYSYIHSHALTHAKLWCTYIKTAAQMLKAPGCIHTSLGCCGGIAQEILTVWKPISVWAGRSPANCIMFRDEEKTWQGAVLKSRRPFLSLFLSPPGRLALLVFLAGLFTVA